MLEQLTVRFLAIHQRLLVKNTERRFSEFKTRRLFPEQIPLAVEIPFNTAFTQADTSIPRASAAHYKRRDS